MPNRIHFLNTDNSDCIILESNGKFAMIDAGEDTEYPPDKPELNLRGFEKEVVEYLKKNCSDENGSITLEFILGTHAHSDHIGGFDTVIQQPNVFIKKAYLKPYIEKYINIREVTNWDNLEVYTQMKDSLKSKNIPIIESFNLKREELGNFKLTFLNGAYKRPLSKTGENRNSVVTLVEINGLKALLTGDLEAKYGAERRIARKAGRVDLLKVGHHGYMSSTSKAFVKKLMPRFAVFCNSSKRVNKETKNKLVSIAGSELFYTFDSNGIIADFNSDINIITDIMQGDYAGLYDNCSQSV